MPLQKQPIQINFAQGLNTKSDPNQVPVGQFLALENSVFTKAGQLTKRNGYGNITTLPDTTSSVLTTFNGNLIAIGNKLEAYSSGNMKWVDKGILQPIEISVLPAARSTFNQIQCDSVIAENGFMCTVYTEVDNLTSLYKYVIADSVTGQNIVAPTAIPVTSGTVSGSPKVFLFGGYFVIIFTNLISATSHLKFIAISTSSPTTVIPNADIAAAYDPDQHVAWDGLVVGNRLFVAYNTSAGGQAIKFTYIDIGFNVTTATTFSGEIATMISLCADLYNPTTPIIYASYIAQNGGYGDATVIAVDYTLQKRMSPTLIVNTEVVAGNIVCAAYNGVVTSVYEIFDAYTYDSSILSYRLLRRSVTLPATVTAGTPGTETDVLRSVGIASKAFTYNGTNYLLATYYSITQPTYFLIDFAGNIYSRFAYQNGGGYLNYGLPQAQVIGDTVSIAYLFKDLIQSVNKTQGATNSSGIYTQTGVNISYQTFGTVKTIAEIGSNLNLTGGFLTSYDGNTITEQNFHVYPDNIELSQIADQTPTGTASMGSATLVVSSASGIVVGMHIADTDNPTYLDADTTVVSIASTTITMSDVAVTALSADNLVFTGYMTAQQYFYQVTYEWTDAQGNIFRSAPSIPVSITVTSGHSSVRVFVPTLRLTTKLGVKIVIYRWSVAQQSYYQVTSITNPVVNDKTTNSIIYTDIQSDAQILGNSLLYTTGGVIEDLPGPACSALTLWDDRVWAIVSEDKNKLAFSKQVIEATPVEMNNSLSLYIAPTTGSAGSTGPMTCIFPMDDKLIIFKKNALNYINGTGPDNTGNNSQYSQPIFITSTVGCTNKNSIVFTDRGLMFQSDKGIWLLGRNLETLYIGAAVEKYNDATVTSAVNLPTTTQVIFTLSNGVTLMYDYFYNQWGVFTNVPGISSTLFNNLHTYLDKYGRVFQETPGTYLDGSLPVSMSFTTAWIKLAGLQGYQRAYFFTLLGQYYSPHKLNIQIAYDYNPQFYQQSQITPDNFNPAWGADSTWGTSSPWGGQAAQEEWQVFMDKQLCESFQITLSEIFDPTLGAPAGQSLTISNLNVIVGAKKGYRPFAGSKQVGGS